MKYTLQRLTSLAEELQKEHDALKTSHEAALQKLRESVDLGVMNKEFAFISAPTIKVSMHEESGRWGGDRRHLEFYRNTGEGYGKYDSAQYPMDDSGAKLLKAKIAAIVELEKEIHASNLALNAHNGSLISKLSTLIRTCGFKDKIKQYDSKRRKEVDVHFDLEFKLRDFAFSYAHAGLNLDTLKEKLFADVDRILAAEKARLAKAEEEKKAKALSDPLLTEAVAYLSARGKVAGTDYALESAVTEANDLAYTEEIARKKASGGPFEFSGQNCDGPCEGWDGEERRCQCGNRRVSWTTGYGHSFKTPSVEAEAY